MRLEREKARARGHAGELSAALLLLFKGYRILARNVRLGGGELDLVALGPWWQDRPAPLVFVEVRVRGSLSEAAASIGPEKRRRIESAAGAFRTTRPSHAHRPCRFDAVLIVPGRAPRHIKDAWS